MSEIFDLVRFDVLWIEEKDVVYSLKMLLKKNYTICQKLCYKTTKTPQHLKSPVRSGSVRFFWNENMGCPVWSGGLFVPDLRDPSRKCESNFPFWGRYSTKKNMKVLEA